MLEYQSLLGLSTLFQAFFVFLQLHNSAAEYEYDLCAKQKTGWANAAPRVIIYHYIEYSTQELIVLQIHRLTASFGKLQGQTLELKDGFNLIQAPNETGKSTWCAFLLAMLYGINSRERDKAGFIAEKNRYAPWSGAAMSGRMDCRALGSELTLTRATRRQSAPMGDFQAVFAGTGDAVPHLTGQTCGETLLGVSREVFERSAFIRQAGLSITQDAGLERRIAALITSGEEDTSYSEVSDALKKQLNRRRHNKTGQIPALEAELAEVQQQLAAFTQLSGQLSEVQGQIDALRAQEAALAEESAAYDRWVSWQRAQTRVQAEADAREARQTAALLRQSLLEERIPENETIGRLRGALVNLETTRKAVEKARGEWDEAAKALLRVEAALSKSPFMGQTPEEARKEAAAPPKVSINAAPSLAVFFGLIAAAAGASLFAFSRCSPYLSGWMKAIPFGIFAVIAAAATVISHRMRVHAVAAAQSAALQKRFGTADMAEIAAQADAYAQACAARDAAQTAADQKSAAANTLYNTLSSNEQAILLEIRRFAPGAFDVSTADHLLRECAARRRALAEAESAAAAAQMKAELLAQQAPVSSEDAVCAPAKPARSQEVFSAELEQTRARLSAARSSADRLTGQLQALGDPAVLQSSAAELASRIAALEGEYAAIQLAMSTLESANTALQNRFSPALGKRSAEIFAELTEHQYSGVVLDRAFHLSAEPTGDSMYRDAQLLSAGAMDQLYLATRLAICELVLPPEHNAPLILDDALANFDDRRCAAALRWLKKEAAHRQILLFTCHSREAAFLAGDSEVSIQQLTNAPERV